MKLIIDTAEWTHIPDRSYYNNNMYYRKANASLSCAREMWIFEVCDESYGDGYFELFECDSYGEQRVYLGYYLFHEMPQEWGAVGTLIIEYGDSIY